MLSLFDNITATMIGTTVFFLMVALHTQMQEASVERTVHYMAKSQAIEAGAWLQDDIANIAAGINRHTSPAQAIEALEEGDDEVTRRFSFRRRLTTDAAAESEVVYTITPADTLVVRQGVGTIEVPVYAVERRIDGAFTGGTKPFFTDFKIELLDASGAPTALREEASQVRLQFATIALYVEKEGYLRRNYWATTVPLRGRKTSN